MDEFTHKRGRLFCEDTPVDALVERYGTPLYVYSRKAFLSHFEEIRKAFAPARPLICYSVKANGNVNILRLLARAGSGFDIVSGGELYRAQCAKAKPDRVVFAGVGKSPEEITEALEAGIFMFNAESPAELEAINRAAESLDCEARVALRVNPDVDARTHAKTTTATRKNKFGIDLHTARELFANRDRLPHVSLCGVHLHLGSPIYSVDPFRKALERIRTFIGEARDLGAEITTLNVGGGYAISYDGNPTIRPRDYAEVILPAVEALDVELCIEPGRFIAGNAGVLITRVVYRKEGWDGRRFVIVDAAMNDLLRPALYGSYHHIWPVSGDPPPAFGTPEERRSKTGLETVDIVGPICETSDCFGADRELPPVQQGDCLAIYSAGAYGMAMASNYNSRPRPCEVLVNGKRTRVIRRRETREDMVKGETREPSQV